MSMNASRSSCGHRGVLDFGLGFLVAGGFLLASVGAGRPGIVMLAACLELGVLGVFVFFGLFRAVLGMFCALLIPMLIVGAACVPVSLDYKGGPSSAAKQIYSTPSPPEREPVKQPGPDPVQPSIHTNPAAINHS